MKIIVVGASGLLGGNCLQHFTEQGCEVIGTHLSFATDKTVYYNTLAPNDSANFDIINYNPDVIVHCGALTHVDYCEQNIEESYEKTVQSTLNLIEVSKNANARLVYISTDYVFDGTKGPYQETDTVNPLNIYGKHKLEAEEAVLSSLKDALVLRVTNVYGDEARGKNFVARIIQQCVDQQKLTLKLPYDQYANPTNAWDIAAAMLLLLQNNHYGIFHIGSTDYMNRVELAQRVLSYFPQAEYDLIPIDTTSLNQPAARPLNGGFLKNKFSNLFPTFLFGTVDSYLQSKIN